jgi:hypothetical protein
VNRKNKVFQNDRHFKFQLAPDNLKHLISKLSYDVIWRLLVIFLYRMICFTRRELRYWSAAKCGVIGGITEISLNLWFTQKLKVRPIKFIKDPFCLMKPPSLCFMRCTWVLGSYHIFLSNSGVISWNLGYSTLSVCFAKTDYSKRVGRGRKLKIY